MLYFQNKCPFLVAKIMYAFIFLLKVPTFMTWLMGYSIISNYPRIMKWALKAHDHLILSIIDIRMSMAKS